MQAAKLADTTVAPVTFPAQYKIIRGADARDLAYAVNLSIRDGWWPIGGIAVAPPNPLDLSTKQVLPFWQALTRPKPRTRKKTATKRA